MTMMPDSNSDVTRIASSGSVWIDRDGTETPITDDKGNYAYPALGPDTKRVAVTRHNQTWIYELDGGRRTRLTQTGASYVPLFSPDGSRLVFGGYLPDENLYWMPSDGSAGPQLLLRAENRLFPLDCHAATDTLILQWTDPESGYDIRALPADGSGPAEPLLDSRHNERWAQLSPDGRWLVSTSDESGRYEIYIVSYPDGRGKHAVSSDGGIEPRWSPRGDEIFYVLGGTGELLRPYTRLAAVPVTSGEQLQIGTPTLLFEGSYPSGMCCGLDDDVAPNGQRFVMVKAKQDVNKSMTIELNAFDRRLGSGGLAP